MAEYERRTYQVEAIEAGVAAFTERERTSVLLESPVGSGKTYMALEIIHRLQANLGRKLKVGWVAPRHHLLRQMMEANRDLYSDNIRPISLFEKTPPEVDLAVLDEAHHEATQSCVLLYEKMRADRVLGLSATPIRTDRMKLSFQETVRTCSIARLVREGYLSPFNTYLIPTYSVENVARFYLAEPSRWGKSLVFFPTIAECVAFRERLAAGGIKCEVVTGESDKERQIDIFARGLVPVVANVAMLTEGFDQPDVASIFARDGSRLPTIQMCGRGLRRVPGKTACNIVQSADSNYLFERVAPPKNAFRWQQGHWLALTDGTEAIERTLKETLRRMSVREKRDRVERKEDFTRAARVAPQKFARKLERLERAEEAERAYYAAFGDVYAALACFLEAAHAICWSDVPYPDCAIHFNKRSVAGRERVTAIPNFLRDGDKVVPALGINLRVCVDPFRRKTVSHRRLAIDILRGMARLRLAPGDEADIKKLNTVMEDLGYDPVSNKFRHGTPVESALKAADAFLADVPPRFRDMLVNPFSPTIKSDAHYHKTVTDNGERGMGKVKR
ncbi:MAG: DEAD/DEAH box helicase family protein [Kiritimatiellae bacterium]|nr:DEAD/DEAH box helicase family protein [Kiritimatiellia bacterium]